MEIKLRDYQQKLVDDIFSKLDSGVKKLLAQLETGGGKSVIIGYLANKLKGRTLILTHRAEILEQNSDWIQGVGVLHSKRNTVGVTTRVVVAMVQTLDARIKKYGLDYIGSFDNIILDEVHVQIFKKVFNQYKNATLIGFTATPVINKRRTFKMYDREYTQEITMSADFDDIVCGPSVQELIDLGFLVQDFNITLKIPNFDNLRESESAPDGYTTKSLNEVYNNKASIDVLLKAMSKYCKGKKTLIFNSTTKNNVFVQEALIGAGYNSKVFDTVNSTGISRKGIVKWFNEEGEAVLIGTNIFTTGFNVPDIECIIVNRATKSLSLWIQMVGRGSRTTNKIFKDTFTVIDLGQNINEHGIWSVDRKWEDYFYPRPPKPKRAVDLVDIWECESCGGFTPKGEVLNKDNIICCSICGEPRGEDNGGGKNKKDKDGELVAVSKVVLPKAQTIIQYSIDFGEGSSNFAFKILENRILNLFIHYNVSDDYYFKNKDAFQRRVREIYTPIYFAIIRSELDGANKKLKSQLKRMFNLIDKYYE